MAEKRPARLRVHLVGGQTIDELDDTITDVEDIEKEVSEPPRPHWCQFGETLVFTQALAAVQLLEAI